MTTPRDIGRYNAIITYTGGNWIGVEQLNTIGNIEISGSSTLLIESLDLFQLDKTTLNVQSIRTGVGVATYLIALETDKVELSMSVAPAEGDKTLIQIEVINI